MHHNKVLILVEDSEGQHSASWGKNEPLLSRLGRQMSSTARLLSSQSAGQFIKSGIGGLALRQLP